MLKRDLYFAALTAGAHYRKAWVLAAFSVTRYNPQQGVKPYDIRYLKDRTEVYAMDPEGNWAWEPVQIEDGVNMQAYIPVFKAGEKIDIIAGEVPNLKVDVKDTTYGDILFNWRVLVYAFGPLFDYQVGPVSIKKIEAVLAERMQDDPLPGEHWDESVIYVTNYLKFGQAMSDLAGFTQLWVPAATERSLQTDPRIRQRRTELLEEHKERLHDPAVVAQIQNELVQMDRDWIKGDPSEGFFLNDKVYNTARKRMFLIHGPEAGFNEGGNAELVVNSLDEGWDMSKLPVMINSLRAGSYYRGALTALGGESVKFFLQIFQNTYISEQDCGSTLGMVKFVDSDYSNFVDMYRITKDGTELMTKEIVDKHKGKWVVMRSPMFCRTGHSDYCETCMGAKNSENKLGLGAQAAAVGSLFMGIMMGSAHAKELKTAKLKVETFLT
jgi:hypothetical protein